MLPHLLMNQSFVFSFVAVQLKTAMRSYWRRLPSLPAIVAPKGESHCANSQPVAYTRFTRTPSHLLHVLRSSVLSVRSCTTVATLASWAACSFTPSAPIDSAHCIHMAGEAPGPGDASEVELEKTWSECMAHHLFNCNCTDQLSSSLHPLTFTIFFLFRACRRFEVILSCHFCTQWNCLQGM